MSPLGRGRGIRSSVEETPSVKTFVNPDRVLGRESGRIHTGFYCLHALLFLSFFSLRPQRPVLMSPLWIDSWLIPYLHYVRSCLYITIPSSAQDDVLQENMNIITE